MKVRNRFSNKIKHFIFARGTLYFSLVLIGGMLTGEMIGILFTNNLTSLPPMVREFVDSVFLLIISFPIYYFFIFHKLKKKIKEIEQTKLAVQLSDTVYRTLVEKMPDGVYKSTHDGKFVDVNPAMFKMLGYESKEELMAIDIKSQLYFEPGDRESIIMEEQLEEMGIFRLKKKDGSEIWVEDHGWYNLDENGKILFHEGILRDITDRRHEELERQVIYEISQSVAMTENLNELMNSIHESLRKMLYAENCYVALYDKNTGLFSFPYFVDQFDTTPEPVELDRSCTAYVLRIGKPLLITPELFKQLEKQNEVKLIGSPSPSWVGVPLKTPDGTIGVLVLQHYTEENVYSEHDLQFLDSVGSQIAVAIERRQAEGELRKERLLLRTVIDNIPDSIYCKDTAGRKTLANQTELLFSQINSEHEILGKTDFDLYPKELAESFFADDQVVLQTGQPVINREEFVLDSNGLKKWLLTSKLPLKDEYGNITGIVGIGHDITNRRQTQEELRESEINLKVILQSTADGILAVNGNGKVIKTNKRFAELWRIPQEIIDSGDSGILLNFVLDQLINPDEFMLKVEKLYNSTDEDLDHVHFRDGRIFERFSAPLNMPDATIGRVWSFRDITERIRNEAEIKLKNENLSKLNAEKDKFFSIIAHDLKGPFNGFLGLTQLMAEQLSSLNTDELQKIAVSMRNSAKNLYHLLENLLEWSQIQKGAFPFNPEIIQVGLVVGSSFDMIHELAKGKDIEITTDIADGLLAFADINMIQTVIRNLVFNAIKFTHKGGKISILAKAATDKSIEISIQDNGIGMSQTMIENLFRIDVQTNRKGTEGELSTGLGLLLCKEFIEKNGGRIWVESEEGKGSTFYFTLPVYAFENARNERLRSQAANQAV
jgi:PAS domain S-box-containing protein